MILQPAEFQDGDDVVWGLVWAAWRRLWKEEEITSVDGLQASSWAKGTMGTCCTHYKKLALWVGFTAIDGLQSEACRYLFQLWGLGFSGSFLRGAVSALRALEEMAWLPEFVAAGVWRCVKWATSQACSGPHLRRSWGAQEFRKGL